jgi:predicted CXXCH cytochrome family protein
MSVEASSAAAPRQSGPVLLAAAVVGTHGPYATTPDQCAICHRDHTGQNKNLLKVVAPQSTLCFTCHDTVGTGANSMTQLQYTDPLVPANSTDNYYRHDALVTTNHTQLQLNEFGGVLNRHDECGDCHNSHAANPSLSTQTTTGWTASGQVAKTSGVSVVNSLTPGAAPTYTFINGVTSQVTREYQLCLKCHSGFTTPLANPTGTPTPYSKYRLDKAIEFNPNNLSYHPVEKAGTNTTTAMTNQLAGTSSFKQWTFTTASTVRCVHCHGDYRKYNLPSPPAAGSDLAPHTSKFRGILMQNYRDRTLKSGTADTFAVNDFALCFMCHAEAPFADTSGSARTDTNFRYHGYHLGKINKATSPVVDIDSPGAGRSNSLCSECHFRIHSTTYKVGAQVITGTRLVNFAPNVINSASPVKVEWNQSGKSCTLTCHGKDHSGKTY